jgi:hypothetical protein
VTREGTMADVIVNNMTDDDSERFQNRLGNLVKHRSVERPE